MTFLWQTWGLPEASPLGLSHRSGTSSPLWACMGIYHSAGTMSLRGLQEMGKPSLCLGWPLM